MQRESAFVVQAHAYGDDDRTLPLAATGVRMKQFAEASRLVVVREGRTA